jgi:transcription elongation factor GreB
MATYITTHGARRLADELRRLAETERPKVVREVADAAAQGDRSENAEYIYGKKRLREIDRRLRFLSKRLDDLSVVPVGQRPPDTSKVHFGARVTVCDLEGLSRTYTLVGPDEADPENGRLSYQAPLGRLLMGRRLDEVLLFTRPAGEVELQITAIEYLE